MDEGKIEHIGSKSIRPLRHKIGLTKCHNGRHNKWRNRRSDYFLIKVLFGHDSKL